MTPDLKTLMHDATENLQPSPALLREVRRGGRRRLLRRRAGAVGVALMAALAVPALTIDLRPDRDYPATASSFAGPLGDGRTHGDLAADERYLTQVRAVWSAWRKSAQWREQYGNASGEVRVLWAGTTPTGPAALLAQQIDVPYGIGGIPGGRQEAHAYIGTSPGGPRVAAASFAIDGKIKQAWYVDPEHRVLAIVDSGRPRGITYRWEYSADGSARRQFTELQFEDGVSIVVLPKEVERYTVHVADLPFRTYRDLVEIANVELDGEAQLRGLHWKDPQRQMHLLLPLGDAESTIGNAREIDTAQLLAGEVQAALDANTDQAGLTAFPQDWIIYGQTPNGTELRVFERQLDTDPARLYALLDGELRDFGPVDPTAALPVRVRLPENQGWVVANYGATLQYRVGASDWTDAGRDAALLPDAATEVRVITSSGRSDVTLD